MVALFAPHQVAVRWGCKCFATRLNRQLKTGLVGAVHLKRQLANDLQRRIAVLLASAKTCVGKKNFKIVHENVLVEARRAAVRSPV